MAYDGVSNYLTCFNSTGSIWLQGSVIFITTENRNRRVAIKLLHIISKYYNISTKIILYFILYFWMIIPSHWKHLKSDRKRYPNFVALCKLTINWKQINTAVLWAGHILVQIIPGFKQLDSQLPSHYIRLLPIVCNISLSQARVCTIESLNLALCGAEARIVPLFFKLKWPTGYNALEYSNWTFIIYLWSRCG